MHKVKGLPQKEVAALLGLSERTVESHVRVGVARCFRYLEANEFDGDHACAPPIQPSADNAAPAP